MLHRVFGVLLAAGLLASAASAQDEPQALFERAMASRARGELHEAIRDFHAILAQHPGLNRARLELAVAYYQAMDHQAALEQARRVLADPATPPEVRANVERLIAQIEAEARPHAFSAFASAGLLYDSNVSAGPASPAYEVGTTLLAVDAGAVQRNDHALTLTLGGSHRWLSGMRPGLGGRDGALLWHSQAMLHRLDYRNESAFDLQVLTLTTGPAWISPPRLRFSAPLQLDRLELGGERYLDIAGASPALVVGNVAGFELQLDGQLQRRDYHRAVDDGRDARYNAAGLQLGRVVARWTVQAGVRRHREDADAGRWDNRGSEWFALAGTQLGSRTSVYARLGSLRARYDEPDPLAAADRRDRERRFAAGVSQRLAIGAGEPWSVSLSLLDTRHRSSIPVYAFKRRQFGITVTRSF